MPGACYRYYDKSIHLVVRYDAIKESVEVVQKLNDLHGCAVGAKSCEPNNITEVNGNLTERFCFHLLSFQKLSSDRFR